MDLYTQFFDTEDELAQQTGHDDDVHTWNIISGRHTKELRGGGRKEGRGSS